MNKKLNRSLKKYDKSKKNKELLISGNLGIALGGGRQVEVSGRKGFVYVRLKGNTSELIQAYNATVPPVYDLPIFVIRENGIYKVVGRNIDRHQNQWGVGAYLPKHGAQHSFNHDINAGGDVVWVWSQQFMPLLSYPSGTNGSMTLSVEPHFYEWQGQWKYMQNTGTPSYAPYLPTITGSARMVLSYIDPTTNGIRLVPGTPFSGLVTGSAEITSFIPDIPRSIGIPLAAVRLTTGTTTLGWDNIYDMRDFYTVGSVITGSVSSIDTIGFAGLDEGVPLGTGTMLNVTGDLSLTRSGTMFNLNYTASAPAGGGGGGVMGWDEGIPVATGTILNVTGPGLTLTSSGTVLNLAHLDIGVRSALTANFAVTGGNLNIPIPYDQDIWDTDNIHSITGSIVDKTKFSPRTAGKYLMVGNVEFAANTTSTRGSSILINGNSIAFNFEGAAPTSGHRLQVSAIYPLVVGDFVQHTAVQNSGGTLNMITGGASWFSMQLLA